MYEGLINDKFKNIIFRTLSVAPYDIVYENFIEAKQDDSLSFDKPLKGLWGAFKNKEDVSIENSEFYTHSWENTNMRTYNQGVYTLDYRLPENCKIFVFDYSDSSDRKKLKEYGIEKIVSEFDAIIETSGFDIYGVPSICITNKETFKNLKLEGFYYSESIDSEKVQITKNLIDNALENIDKCGFLLKYLDEDSKSNYNICKRAINQNVYAINYVNKDLLKNKDFVLDIMKSTIENNNEYARIYDCLPPEMKIDKDICFEAAKKYHSLDGIPKHLITKEMVAEVVSLNCFSFLSLPNNFKNDLELISSLNCTNNTYKDIFYKQVVRSIDSSFLNNKDFCLMMVKKSGVLLESFDNFTSDKDVVLEAVKENGYALKFADKKFLKDEEILLEAIKSNINVMNFVDNDLKNDEKFILKVIEKIDLEKFMDNLDYFERYIDIDSKPIETILINKFQEYKISEYFDKNALEEKGDMFSVLSDFYKPETNGFDFGDKKESVEEIIEQKRNLTI